MNEDKKKYYIANNNFEAYDMGTGAEKDVDKSNSETVKLKNDGNVTKQIYDGVGFETLQSYYNVYQKNEES